MATVQTSVLPNVQSEILYSKNIQEICKLLKGNVFIEIKIVTQWMAMHKAHIYFCLMTTYYKPLKL